MSEIIIVCAPQSGEPLPAAAQVAHRGDRRTCAAVSHSRANQ